MTTTTSMFSGTARVSTIAISRMLIVIRLRRGAMPRRVAFSEGFVPSPAPTTRGIDPSHSLLKQIFAPGQREFGRQTEKLNWPIIYSRQGRNFRAMCQCSNIRTLWHGYPAFGAGIPALCQEHGVESDSQGD